jgi:hypothetical protein
MTISTGSSLQNRSSTATKSWTQSIQGGLGICVVAGIVAALVDLELHVPLHMPGWRGLITIGVLVAARRLSDRPWGASAAALVAALVSIALAGAPRFGTLSFLAPGLVIDAVCLTIAAGRTDLLAAAFGGAIGNAAKLAVSLVGIGVATRRNMEGFAFYMPWLGHLAFGLAGGLLAVLCTPGSRRAGSTSKDL